MADEDIHIRLAVGAFDVGAQLWAALHDLLQMEFGVDQLCLAALEETFATTVHAASAPEILNPYVSELTDKMGSVHPFGTSGAQLWASDWLLDALHPGQPVPTNVDQGTWMLPRQKDQLVGLIDRNHVVLGVRSLDLDQHKTATRLLLTTAKSAFKPTSSPFQTGNNDFARTWSNVVYEI